MRTWYLVATLAKRCCWQYITTLCFARNILFVCQGVWGALYGLESTKTMSCLPHHFPLNLVTLFRSIICLTPCLFSNGQSFLFLYCNHVNLLLPRIHSNDLLFYFINGCKICPRKREKQVFINIMIILCIKWMYSLTFLVKVDVGKIYGSSTTFLCL